MKYKILIIVGALLLSGCTQEKQYLNEDKNIQVSGNTGIEEQEVNHYLNELNYTEDVEELTTGTLEVIKVRSKEFAKETLKEVLGTTGEISVREDSIRYITPKGADVLELINLRTLYPPKSYMQQFGAVLDGEDIAFDFATKEEVVQEVFEYARQIGIDPREEHMQVYSIQGTQLNALQDKLINEDYFLKEYTKKDLSKGYDCYYILFESGMNDVAIYSQSFSDRETGDSIEGTIVSAIVSAGGIELFNMNGELYQEVSREKVAYTIQTAEKAAEKVVGYLSQDLALTDIQINRVDMCYIPNITNEEEVTLVPIWCFFGEANVIIDMKTQQKHPIRLDLKVNPITGEIIN